MLKSILASARKSNRIHKLYRDIRMRYVRLRLGLRNVDSTFYMAGRSNISPDLRAGPHSFIADGCRIYPRVSIGAYTMLGPKVSVVGADHRFDMPGVPMVFAGRPNLPQTVIEDDVWVGLGAIVMCGVRIGRGSIIAAGAVVTRDVPRYEVHGGVPAAKIRDRFAVLQDRLLHDSMLDGSVVDGRLCTALPDE